MSVRFQGLPGEAYVNGVAKPDWDLAMRIAEYVDEKPPVPETKRLSR